MTDKVVVSLDALRVVMEAAGWVYNVFDKHPESRRKKLLRAIASLEAEIKAMEERPEGIRPVIYMTPDNHGTCDDYSTRTGQYRYDYAGLVSPATSKEGE